MGRALAALDITVDAIISSPLRRATQTAAVVANEIDHEEKVVIDNALRPGATYEQFQELLAPLQPQGRHHGRGPQSHMTEFLNKLVRAPRRIRARTEKGRDRAGGKRRPQGRGTEVVHAAEGGALDSAGLGQQFASKDRFEVISSPARPPTVPAQSLPPAFGFSIRRTRPS